MKLTAKLTSILILAIIIVSSADAGVYQLAYWRELGAYENQAPPAGTYGLHDVWIHVWNEDGTPRSGVNIRNTSWYYFGVTNSHGILHIQLWSSDSDFWCGETMALSDVTPIFSERRAPHWGHYSWEVGFVYRESSTPDGEFDLNCEGVLNSTSGDNCDIDAPATRSLAFISTDPEEACSDPFSDVYVTEAGQTFVATGDRVIAAKAWVNAGVGYYAQILEGGPGGAPVGPVAAALSEDQYQKVLAVWSFDDVPVVPGNTYYLKITALGGGVFTVKRTQLDNYPGGCFYANQTAQASFELMGAVVMAWKGYGSLGRISGRVTDTSGNPLQNAVIEAQPGAYRAQSDSGGYYTFYGMPAGTYSLTASKWGYSKETLYGRTVSVGTTTTVDFDRLVPLTNTLQNPGFESDLDYWTRHNTFNVYAGEFAVTPHGGQKWAGNVISLSGWSGGLLSQQVNVEGDYKYRLAAWILTDSFDGERDYEYPSNNLCRIGLDPTGSGDPLSFNIQWTSYKSSHNYWSELSLEKNAQPPYAQMTVWLNYSIRDSHDWNKAGFDDVFFCRSQPAVVIDIDPSVSNILATSATISWHTNVASDSRVDYGTTSSYGQSKTVSGSVTSHSVTITGLQPNTTYHFKVTSAQSGYLTDSSDDFTFTTAPGYVTVNNIADLDGVADGTEVMLPAKLVTAGVDQIGGMFYIQETDYFSGIRVNCTDSSVHEGDIRDVYGVLSTVGHERCIECTQATLVSSGNPVPNPYGMRLDQVGGAAVGNNAALDSVGLLVRTCGTRGIYGVNYMFLQDQHGNQVKVFTGTLAKPSGWLAVTGVCGTVDNNGEPMPVIRVRKQSDMNELD